MTKETNLQYLQYAIFTLRVKKLKWTHHIDKQPMNVLSIFVGYPDTKKYFTIAQGSKLATSWSHMRLDF